MKSSFGDILRKWRKQQRYSQMQLALELDISSKHISFLETGRSIPSRNMILKIGLFLLLPKSEINHALFVAGYAPAFTELNHTHVDLKPVFHAIDQMLINHMPYPALVLNQHWDLVKANDSAKSLLIELGFSKNKNLIEAFIADDPETSSIINWHETVALLMVRLRSEISLLGGSALLEELEKRLSAKLDSENEVNTIDSSQTVLSTQITLSRTICSFFSIIAQLGTVQDVAVSELKIELMFPADDKTREFYEQKK